MKVVNELEQHYWALYVHVLCIHSNFFETRIKLLKGQEKN